jgi:hypothetical protein
MFAARQIEHEHEHVTRDRARRDALTPLAPFIALLVILAACGDAAPKSTAYRIGSLQDTIGGPHAIGTIGDFMLENDQVRFVIADTGVNTNDPSKTTYGRVNTTFGGTLVDADIRRPGGGNARGKDLFDYTLHRLQVHFHLNQHLFLPAAEVDRCW